MNLNDTEKRLFALLRGGLQTAPTDASLFTGMSEEEWQDCYTLAAKHGVMAIAWDGVIKLPMELRRPIDFLLIWGLEVQNYEERYHYYCDIIHELSDFYARHGIATVQLKGVGLSAYYPVPKHREGGDIDIFTYSADPVRMNHSEANRLADELMRQQGIDVDVEHSEKHSCFYYKGISIENHKTFLNVESFKIAARTEPLLQRILQPQATPLDDGRYEILTPSAAFNTVFVSFHAAQHYGSGLSLHHLCDWACLIQKHGLHLPEEVTDKRLVNMIHALTTLCNNYLGTSTPAHPQSEKLANEILGEILHPPYGKHVPVQGKWNILVYKTHRFLYRFRLKNRVLGKSLAKSVWDSIVMHIRFPENIFGTSN